LSLYSLYYSSTNISQAICSLNANMHDRLLLTALACAASVSARDVPSNVQSFYNSLKSNGACSNRLVTGFYNKEDGPNSTSRIPLPLSSPTTN
jgi:hypothetical protein